MKVSNIVSDFRKNSIKQRPNLVQSPSQLALVKQLFHSKPVVRPNPVLPGAWLRSSEGWSCCCPPASGRRGWPSPRPAASGERSRPVVRGRATRGVSLAAMQSVYVAGGGGGQHKTEEWGMTKQKYIFIVNLIYQILGNFFNKKLSIVYAKYCNSS